MGELSRRRAIEGVASELFLNRGYAIRRGRGRRRTHRAFGSQPRSPRLARPRTYAESAPKRAQLRAPKLQRITSRFGGLAAREATALTRSRLGKQSLCQLSYWEQHGPLMARARHPGSRE
jgi:hypothetical protein